MTSHCLMLDIQLPRALGGWFTLSLPQSCVDPTLGTRTSAALERVDETMSVSPLTAMVRICPQGMMLWFIACESTPESPPLLDHLYVECCTYPVISRRPRGKIRTEAS
jgi:hypothetical protein